MSWWDEKQKSLIHRTIRLEESIREDLNEALGVDGDKVIDLDALFTDFVQDLRDIWNIDQDLIDEVAMEETR